MDNVTILASGKLQNSMSQGYPWLVADVAYHIPDANVNICWQENVCMKMWFTANLLWPLCLCQVCTVGPASRTTARQCDKGRYGGTSSTTKVGELDRNSYREMHDYSTHKCPHCGSSFKEKGQLTEHVRAKHMDSRFGCLQCRRTFVTKGGLSEHVRRIHQKLSRYRCETCGKDFYIRSNYYDHLATHTGVKRHICPMCQKQFTFKRGLKAHVLSFHPNDINCICDFT